MDSNTNKKLNSAIKKVEQYISELKPKNYYDIKSATQDISQAAIGAYLSVHSLTETLEFINHLAHVMVNDIAENIRIPEEYKNKIH